MVLDDASFKHVKIVDTLSSYIVSISFLVVISLFVIQLFRKCAECCKKSTKKSSRPPKPSVPNRYELLGNKRRSTAVLPPANPRTSVCIGNIESYRNAQFEIPGMVSCESIQPTDSSSASGSGSVGGSVDEYINNRYSLDEKFVEEYVQPDAGETLIPLQRPKNRQYGKSPDLRSRSPNLDAGLLEGQLNKELYEACPRRTQGSSSLGKVLFTLQYEDNAKKKLLMILQKLCNLKFTKLNENVELIVLAVMLLPEREYIYKTKELQRTSADIKIEESFAFHSRPRNRDFESRTIVVTIIYLCPNTGKEIMYGEARLPLLCHEIYSQVPTSVSVGVTAIMQNEIGDAQIQLSYSSTQQNLSVLIKTIHFTNVSLLDKIAGLHIKTYLVSESGEKLSKKKVVSKNIRTNDNVFVEFQEPISFKLPLENYSLCTMKMSIHGKHKIMVKHLSFGKIRIGEHSPGDCGKVHWKTALTSQEIAWTMWHPIYSG